jgi:Polyketide cyclase / dehydrase and lipid transport
MGPISVSRSIDAPRDRVYGFLCDLANRPAFTDHFIGDCRLERFESAGVGAAARMRLARGGLWMETVIVEADPPYRILEQGKGGRLDRIPILTAWEIVEGPGADSSVVTLRFGTEPSHPVDRLHELRRGERYFRRQWSTGLSRLKDLIESGRPAERLVIAGGAHVPVA